MELWSVRSPEIRRRGGQSGGQTMIRAHSRKPENPACIIYNSTQWF
jgi:hypothetical protein